jgi:hypothetical protein
MQVGGWGVHNALPGAPTGSVRARGVSASKLLRPTWLIPTPPPPPPPPPPQRDFALAGPAATSELLPADRRARVNAARNSQLYVKDILPQGDGPVAAPGKRIGF